MNLASIPIIRESLATVKANRTCGTDHAIADPKAGTAGTDPPTT